MGKLTRAVGLMSGTSLDGIDVALIATDGDRAVELGPALTFPYNSGQREALAGALAEARAMTERHQRPGALADTEQMLTELHAAAFHAFLRKTGTKRGDVDVIGFHGQTVLHRPDQRLTVQLGDGPGLARLTGRDVVYDLRAADVAAGGQGAPLVPVYHRALVERLPERPVAFVNVGGVANVTWIGRQGELIAFDTGPGNALIDDWMLARTGRPCDVDGACAASGRVDEAALSVMLSEPYFTRPPPKSLDRNHVSSSPVAALSLEDAAATLTALTAAAIARAREHFPEEPRLWVIAGGGRRNRALMTTLAGRVSAAVAPVEAVDLDGDAVEAEAWGYLAVRSLKGWPITFPGTTGVEYPTTGGVLARP